ncbi:BTB/POZ domain-containing protein 6-A-like [Zerene cesonia]|uniref:BTB/POZ domain-containing protein 6-A-like n=1 Tax=Zerene cesonia TaxID=33412 RepID=UPI0018E56AE5|nr:BTB/POZ domain-containing protein 6-A-like [Zerene cesonia]XP_038209666.1 BTB/POZ domain-containing protein 6-A-like [Zerene cesonia]
MGFKMSDFKNNSLYDRMNKLLVSYDWSDCNFIVCGKEFKAHKLILGISSPVFEAMFYGPLSSNDNIIITDIDPTIFQLLLHFIYTDKVHILSIEQAYDLLYVSKKYLLDSLTGICIEYIEGNMSIDNVIKILNYPDYMQENEILTSALNLFCQHAHYLLQEHKTDISISCLRKILECNDINVSEKDLIKITFEWTLNYCEQNDISIETVKCRDILLKSGLFALLRFHILSEDELDEIALDKTNLLLPTEIEDIKQIVKKTLNSPDNSNKKLDGMMCVIPIPRNVIKIQWHLCHRALIRSESPISIDSHNNCIYTRLKADKSFFIHSLKIQSRMAPVDNFCNSINTYVEEFSISIMSESDNSIIRKLNFKKEIEYDSNIDIEFLEPLCIRKDKWYRIGFIWPNQRLFDTHLYSVQSRDLCYMLYNNKIKFEFQDILSLSDSCGSFLKGLKFCL